MDKKYLDKSIKHIFLYIIKRIYVIIVLAVATGALLGTVRGKQIAASQIKEMQDKGYVSVEKATEGMAEQDISDAYGVFSAYKTYHNYLKFMSDSVRMNLDSLNVPEAVLLYRIDTEKSKGEIQTMYRRYLLDSCDMAKDETGGNLLIFKEGAETGIFTVTTIGKDLDEAAALASVIKGVMEELSDSIVDSGLDHSLILVTEKSAIVEDEMIRNEQMSNIELIKKASEDLSAAQDTLNNNSKYLYNVLCNADSNSEIYEEGTPEYEEIISKKFNLTYGMFGAIIGVLVGVVLLIASYTFKPYIYTNYEAANLLGTEELGLVTEQNKTYIFNSLLLLCKNNGYKSLAVVTTQGEKIELIYSEMHDLFSAQGVKLGLFTKDIMSGEELVDIAEMDAVLSFEVCKKSKIRKLIDICNVCKRNKIKLLGSIVC